MVSTATYLETTTYLATTTDTATATQTVLQTGLSDCLGKVSIRYQLSVICAAEMCVQCKSQWSLSPGNSNQYNTYASATAAATSMYAYSTTNTAYAAPTQAADNSYSGSSYGSGSGSY